MKNLILVILLAVVAHQSFGAVYKTVQSDETYTHKNCEQTDSCSLKSFRVRVEDAKVVSSSFGTNYTTGSFMSYTTDTVEDIEMYGIVQFIKGCQFQSDHDGSVNFGISREFFGDIKTFKHPKWVIDSVDEDAMYNSTILPDYSRHAMYRWNDIIGSFKKETEHYLYEQRPTRATVYVKDRPGSAFYDTDTKDAKNISLQFKSCIFKTEDIEASTTPSGMDTSKAIKCFDWHSSYVFNHKTLKFNKQNKISKHCLAK